MGFGTRDISPATRRNKVMDLEIKKRWRKKKDDGGDEFCIIKLRVG